jgi:hypothetical protein
MISMIRYRTQIIITAFMTDLILAQILLMTIITALILILTIGLTITTINYAETK